MLAANKRTALSSKMPEMGSTFTRTEGAFVGQRLGGTRSRQPVCISSN